MIKAQHHYARNQQQFVCQRVENRPKLAALIKPPRDVAVHAIADGGECETKYRQQTIHLMALPDVVEYLHHEKRDQQDAQDGDLVSCCHG